MQDPACAAADVHTASDWQLAQQEQEAEGRRGREQRAQQKRLARPAGRKGLQLSMTQVLENRAATGGCRLMHARWQHAAQRWLCVRQRDYTHMQASGLWAFKQCCITTVRWARWAVQLF